MLKYIQQETKLTAELPLAPKRGEAKTENTLNCLCASTDSPSEMLQGHQVLQALHQKEANFLGIG